MADGEFELTDQIQKLEQKLVAARKSLLNPTVGVSPTFHSAVIAEQIDELEAAIDGLQERLHQLQSDVEAG